MKFDASTIEAVIHHMNTDHADACLLIVQAHSPHQDALRAKLIDFTGENLTFDVVDSADESERNNVSINLNKPLTDSSQIRGALVELTKSARQTLANRN